MKKSGILLSILLLLGSCKKAEERTCIKGYGDEQTIEIPIDSVSKFYLYKNLSYRIYQDTLKKIVLTGGSNMISNIEVTNSAGDLSIRNLNRCHFLRDYEKRIFVDIHYPTFERFYCESQDTLMFMDTITSPNLYIEQVLGGGHVKLHIEGGNLVLIARNGVGSFNVSGHVNHADLRVQANGSGIAQNLSASSFEIYQNSTADIRVNINQAETYVDIRGTGHVIYTGIPDTLNLIKSGAGEMILE